jgi:hypothetical protein
MEIREPHTRETSRETRGAQRKLESCTQRNQQRNKRAAPKKTSSETRDCRTQGLFETSRETRVYISHTGKPTGKSESRTQGNQQGNQRSTEKTREPHT